MSPSEKLAKRYMGMSVASGIGTFIGLSLLVPLLKPHFPAEHLQPQADLGMIVLALFLAGGGISLVFFLTGFNLMQGPQPTIPRGLHLIALGFLLPVGVYMWLKLFEVSFGELFSGFTGDPPIGLGLLFLVILGVTGLVALGLLVAGIRKSYC